MRAGRGLLAGVAWVLLCLPALAGEQVALAVLTFQNLTGKPENDWMAAGFAESLTRKLAAIDGLRLQDRRRIATAARVQKIDQRLLDEKNLEQMRILTGSDYVIFGAVQSAGDLQNPAQPLRVTARIVEVRTGRVTKAVLVDGPTGELFALETKLARSMADLMGLQRTVAEERGLEYAGTTSLEAYRLYQQGLQALDAQAFAAAIEDFNAACAAHPGILYADAHYALGTAYIQSGRQEELLRVYKQDAARLSAVFFNLGAACEKTGDNEKALAAYKTFVRYAFNRREAREAAAVVAGVAGASGAAGVGERTEAEGGANAVVAPAGPADLDGYLAIARLCEAMQRWEDAAGACAFVLSNIDHDNRDALAALARLYRRAGRNDLAESIEKRLREAGRSDAFPLGALAPGSWLQARP